MRIWIWVWNIYMYVVRVEDTRRHPMMSLDQSHRIKMTFDYKVTYNAVQTCHRHFDRSLWEPGSSIAVQQITYRYM